MCIRDRVIFLLSAIFAPELFSLDYLAQKSATIRRFVTVESQGEGGFNTIRERLNMYSARLARLYKWQGWRVPFIGAGFYVAPHSREDGTLKYRVGYGVHNSYLFALEQGGIVAFLLFIAFLVVLHRSLKYVRRFAFSESDRAFAWGIHSFLMALFVVLLPGQVFWYGFGKVNFNTYLILLFMLAVKISQEDELPYDYADDQCYDYGQTDTDIGAEKYGVVGDD